MAWASFNVQTRPLASAKLKAGAGFASGSGASEMHYAYFNNTNAKIQNPTTDNGGLMTFIHEIGHVFGLRHFFANVSETWSSSGKTFSRHWKRLKQPSI